MQWFTCVGVRCGIISPRSCVFSMGMCALYFIVVKDLMTILLISLSLSFIFY